jgi:Tol biopolymer transport system component
MTVKTKVLIIAALLGCVTGYAQERFSAETLWKLGRVSEMQLSPSEKTILYGVTWYDVAANKGNRDLFILEENAESPRKLTDTKGSEINGIWRPDGRKIGYLSAEGGSMQLWEMGINGEDKKQVTNIEGGINGFSYSPDMKHIAYIMDM